MERPPRVSVTENPLRMRRKLLRNRSRLHVPVTHVGETTLGVSTDELRDAVREGRSIADVAAEKNVPVDLVIDALVADAKARIAERDLPEGRSAPTDAEIREAVTKMVNGELRFGRGRPGR